ncbi:MAG: hypothetical protein ACE5E7_13145 [Anaerolineae bacterium]
MRYRKSSLTIESTVALFLLAILFTGCANSLLPQMTYQGRLTDAGGNALNGSYTLHFRWYHQDTGGTPFHTENHAVTATDGLFDTVVGPATTVAGLTPEELSQPIWVEIAVNNGTISETLSPRQRLYGAPYAFSLMPGTVISSSMDSNIFGAGGLDAVVNIYNTHADTGGNPALPALRLVGETSMELTSPTSDDGTIYSDQSSTVSDLLIHSNDEIWLYLDDDNNSISAFRVYNGGGTKVWEVNESGNTFASGTKSAVVQVAEQQRLMYAMESPEVWFEDFGSGALQNGSTAVTVDPLFAKTVNLGSGYHVFLTPLGDCNGLYVANKSSTGFEVRELGGGTSNVSFDYRIVAKRAGYETLRLEPADTGPQAEDQ